jgi:hypothetical protein
MANGCAIWNIKQMQPTNANAFMASPLPNSVNTRNNDDRQRPAQHGDLILVVTGADIVRLLSSYTQSKVA